MSNLYNQDEEVKRSGTHFRASGCCFRSTMKPSKSMPYTTVRSFRECFLNHTRQVKDLC